MPVEVRRARRGFTLIELLVVIGIIGILMGVLLATFGGASESAKAAKCMTNMRNLAVAVYNAAMTDQNGAYPAAGSYEHLELDGYTETVGWITWNRPRPPHGSNPYARTRVSGSRATRGPRQSQVSSSWFVSLAYKPSIKEDYDTHRSVLTNGLAWAHVGKNAETYVCPKHVEAFRQASNRGDADAQGYMPCWSYVMNSYFGYDNVQGKSQPHQYRLISGLYSLRQRVPLVPEKVLLFAEVPFEKDCPVQADVKLRGEGALYNTVLEYNEKPSGNLGLRGQAEAIGFNHRAGKRWKAHVAFADGHVASLLLPLDASEQDVRDLTTWLCQGDDVTMSAGRYERERQVDDQLN